MSGMRVPLKKAAGWYYSLTTQPATDSHGTHGNTDCEECRKPSALERKQVKTAKKCCKKLSFCVDVREVTGSSPVSSTIKTALFERKKRFFLTFSPALCDGIPSGLSDDHTESHRQEKCGLRRTIASRGRFSMLRQPFPVCEVWRFLPSSARSALPAFLHIPLRWVRRHSWPSASR